MATTIAAGRRPGASIGVKAGAPPDLVRQLEAGLPYSAVEKLRKATGLTLERIGRLARISDRTLARRRQDGRLSPEESERILRLARVFEQALSLFEGNQAAAMRWLETPRPVFGRKSALEFAQTDIGAREVEDTIERIEYGVIS
jgi:putative toxin-antitoxin system antitoxin component (TIGR02293 family)